MKAVIVTVASTAAWPGSVFPWNSSTHNAVRFCEKDACKPLLLEIKKIHMHPPLGCEACTPTGYWKKKQELRNTVIGNFFTTVFNTFSWLIMVSTISLVAIFVRAYVKGNF